MVVCYLFTKGCGPSLPVLYTKAAVLIIRFVYKGLWSLSFAIHLQRTAVLVFCYSFAKDCCPCLFAIQLQRTAVLVLCYLLAKDCGPCLLLFICKGLRSLSSGIHLQRTAVLVLCYSFAKDCGPCLVPLVCKETAVLIFHFCPSKIKMDCSPSKAWGTAFLPGLMKTAVS